MRGPLEVKEFYKRKSMQQALYGLHEHALHHNPNWKTIFVSLMWKEKALILRTKEAKQCLECCMVSSRHSWWHKSAKRAKQPYAELC